MTNITNASDVRKRRKQHNLTERQRRADFKELMQVPAFQRIVREILGWAHLYHPSYNPLLHGGEALPSAFREGERNVGLRLFAELERANPTAFYTHVLLPGVHERVAEERKAEQANAES